jgi:hypothetical protein
MLTTAPSVGNQFCTRETPGVKTGIGTPDASYTGFPADKVVGLEHVVGRALRSCRLCACA